MASEIDAARYVSFVSYKKDGTPVATPVWIVPFQGGYAFTTDPDSYKIRRIRNDARASIVECDMRGKVREGATVFHGAALVLDTNDSHAVSELIRKKYSIGTKLLGILSIVKKMTGKGTTAGDAAIKVTINA